MHENLKLPRPDMHSDEWWLRVFEGTLSTPESRLWATHLAKCTQCRLEWAAFQAVEQTLLTAPPPPMLNMAFTAQTTARVMKKQQLQQLLHFLGSVFVIAFVAWGVLSFLGTTYLSVERTLSFIFLGRQVLFSSLVHTLLALFTSWKTLLPFTLFFSGVILMLLMPNGMLATWFIFWLARRQPVMGRSSELILGGTG